MRPQHVSQAFWTRSWAISAKDVCLVSITSPETQTCPAALTSVYIMQLAQIGSAFSMLLEPRPITHMLTQQRQVQRVLLAI